MYKITAHFARNEVRHFPEQDCDIVMCQFLRKYLIPL